MFTVSAAQLTQAAGVTLTLTQPGATALVNVTTDTQLTLSEQYMNLTGTTAANVAWNLPLATKLTLNGSVDWQGLILAPNAELHAASNGQIHGQLIARHDPDGEPDADQGRRSRAACRSPSRRRRPTTR